MRSKLRKLFASRHSTLFTLIVAQLATVAGAFLINILSARALGPTNRGEIAFILQLSYIAGAVTPLGRDRSVLQLPRSQLSRGPSVLRNFGKLPIGLLLLFTLLFGAWQIISQAPEATPLVTVCGFGMLLLGNLMSRFYRSQSIISDSGSIFLLATLAGQIGLVALGGVLLAQQVDSVPYWILAYGATLCVPFLIFLQRPKASDDGLSQTELDRAKDLGLRMLPSSLIEMAMTKADKILLPLLSSFTVLGYYAIAVSLVDFAILPFRQFVDSRIPSWAAQHRAGTFKLSRTVAPVALLSVLLVSSTVAASYFAIPILFGLSYSPALTILPWLGVATYFHILTVLMAGIATAFAKSRPLLRMHATGIVCAIPLHFVLIPHLAANGAAMAQAIGYALSTAAGFILLWRGKKSRETI